MLSSAQVAEWAHLRLDFRTAVGCIVQRCCSRTTVGAPPPRVDRCPSHAARRGASKDAVRPKSLDRDL